MLLMKNLEQKEWIAVTVGLIVVGFFFLFGQTIISLLESNTQNTVEEKKQGVVIQEVVVGTGESAESGKRVVVHYTGRFIDGTVFDSSVTRGEPFQFVLGVGQVIPGWDQGILGMKVGGKRILSVPPELGYGATDYGPIPGGSTLIFEVELLKVE